MPNIIKEQNIQNIINIQNNKNPSRYNILAESNDETVVSEYIPEAKTSKEYQTEQDLENDFIHRLSLLGYEYLPIKNEKDLIDNLKVQLEKLNNISLSTKEWKKIKEKLITSNLSIKDKTKIIQQDYIIDLIRDDGSLFNFYLIDKKNIHNNSMQVINQYEENKGKRKTRYDVSILVNGVPLIHVELKKRGVPIREAFNQINRYQRDSFWAGSGLYEYVQIFVISNGTHTKYFSNTTREFSVQEANRGKGSKRKTSNSFMFTSYWADSKNKNITDLVDFTKTFFSKNTILNILTKYCVFTSDEMLLVMRPYQITQCEKILERIKTALNYKWYGSIKAGGYINSSTGSGKTLTSFKTAQLASQLDEIDKVLFVVDRKDLDYQTIKEYDKFEKGAVNSNKSTKILAKQLNDKNSRIIVTTIQKLSNFINISKNISKNSSNKNQKNDIFNKKIVMIFDECHRSQFGAMHKSIKNSFSKYFIFGFTGTPIYAKNANTRGKDMNLLTTEQAFGDKLHTYSITDAINDGNVLPFRIDYINTLKYKNDKTNKDNEDIENNENTESNENVQGIDTSQVLNSSERIEKIVNYIITHFNSKTKRDKYYSYNGKVKKGFNSILATDSIPMATKYYKEFQRQLSLEKNKNQDIKIATIFSFNPNEEDPNDIFSDEDLDASSMNQSSRDFLDSAINDYNKMFGTNYDSSSESFQNYYKDLSLRMKNKEIDLLIVVNMFLTGFDATTLNTLWVDKNLKMHGLLQAFSRTNRILNSVKSFGNIICFRNLQNAVDDAISLFGDKDAQSVVILKDYNSYYYGYDEFSKNIEDIESIEKDKNNENSDEVKVIHHKGYVEYIQELLSKYPLPLNLLLDKDKKEFIKLYSSILRLRNILTCFDQFEEYKDFDDRTKQNYQSEYIDLYNEFKENKTVDKESIQDDIIFEIELVKQIQVSIDYILTLVAKYHESNCQDKEIAETINKSIDASYQLRSKKQLILDFIKHMNNPKDIDEEWKSYIKKEAAKELDEIILTEKLNKDETISYMKKAFQDGEFRTIGTSLNNVLPAISYFNPNRKQIREHAKETLKEYFDKYSDIL